MIDLGEFKFSELSKMLLNAFLTIFDETYLMQFSVGMMATIDALKTGIEIMMRGVMLGVIVIVPTMMVSLMLLMLGLCMMVKASQGIV